MTEPFDNYTDAHSGLTELVSRLEDMDGVYLDGPGAASINGDRTHDFAPWVHADVEVVITADILEGADD